MARAAIATGGAATDLRDLRAAAEAEDALLTNVTEPGLLAPAREPRGDALLGLGQAAEAEAAFEACCASMRTASAPWPARRPRRSRTGGWMS